MASNRYAEVVELPINYIGNIEKGDTLLVHHNVFKIYYDMRGRDKSSGNFFKDDLFLLEMTNISYTNIMTNGLHILSTVL